MSGSKRYNRYHLLWTAAHLPCSVRLYRCLLRVFQREPYLIEIVARTEKDILKIHNLGRKTLNELQDHLAQHNLALGMPLTQRVLQWAERELDGVSLNFPARCKF